jgi:hypothetical protein
MALGLGKGVAFSKYSGVAGGGGPTTRASITALNADGWTANDNTPITYDPVGDPQYVISLDAGFDGSGNAATVTRNLLIRKRLRQAYPSQGSLTSNTAIIGDYIYATSSIVGFTNNSTRAAPKPGAMWLNRDQEVVTSATSGIYTARLAVAHPYARSGRPVAAVKFLATDGTTTVSTVVSTMSSIQYSASGLYVPHFAGALDFTTLTQGAAITVWAIIYPWVGAAFDISTDADTYPSPNLTTLKVLNNRTGAYGIAYVCVDPVSGNNGTGVASTTRATAVASPYLTFSTAAAALKTYANANLGNRGGAVGTDNCVILLKAGTTTLDAGIATVASNTNWPLTIEAENSSLISTTIFADKGVTLTGTVPFKTVIRNVTIKRGATGSITFLDANAGNLSYIKMIAFENVVSDDGGFGTYNGWIYKPGLMFAINCSGINCGQSGITGTVNKTLKSIGCTAVWASSQTNFGQLGCSGGSVQQLAATTARVASVGLFYGWSYVTSAPDGSSVILGDQPVNDRGYWIVGNVVERIGGTTTPVVKINADSDLSVTQNINFLCNTIVGARMNHQYQDLGSTTVAKSGYVHYNVLTSGFNTKTDVFPTADGNRVGNWPAAFHIGYKYNGYLRGDSNAGSAPGVGVWLGEMFNEGEVSGTTGTPLAANFVNDASIIGTNLGGGNYRPQAGHALPLIPAGYAPYNVDMNGTAIANDGTAVVGALQM